MQAFREFKSLWDPDWKMNPGKVVDPYPHGRGICGWARTTSRWIRRRIFSFLHDGGSFSQATLRCVGVGNCRRHGEGHDVPKLHGDAWRRSTPRAAGRACCSRCCSGEVIRDGWKSEDSLRRAGSVPFLQGLQGRLSGERGHGDVQSRISVALLRRAAAAAARVRIWADPSLVASGIGGAGTGEPGRRRRRG